MKIIVYCGTGGPGAWDSRNIECGIGGSEEAVVYLSRELTKLGHQVEVYNGRKDTYRDENGATWIPHTCALGPCDIFIAWRQWELVAKSTGKRVYLWEQDWPVFPHFSPEAKSLVEQGKFKMIMLNEHHRNQYGIAPEHAFVCSNGADISQFNQNVERIPGKCIYLSHPSRGLLQLREYWPKIRAAVPHATLHSFWWESEVLLPANESIGIMPMRSLGHMELAREILSAEFLAYPSIFTPEISPVSCIKAQCGGAWPVTVNCGGMADTLMFGTFVNHGDYVGALTLALLDSNAYDRDSMMSVARQTYSWRSIAERWEKEFQQNLA